MNHMLLLSACVCKKGLYQFIYLNFSLYKNFVLTVKSYLMKGYIFHNGKRYLKKQVM